MGGERLVQVEHHSGGAQDLFLRLWIDKKKIREEVGSLKRALQREKRRGLVMQPVECTQMKGKI